MDMRELADTRANIAARDAAIQRPAEAVTNSETVILWREVVIRDLYAEQAARLKAEVNHLRLAVSELGKHSNTCVSSYLHTRCIFCECGADALGTRP